MALFARPKRTPEPETDAASPHSVRPDPVVERSIAAYRDHLLREVVPLRPFGIGLLDAAGLSLCESLSADLDLPIRSHATASGWGVRAANIVGASAEHPVVLPVLDEIGVGDFPGEPLPPGAAVKVAAGAPIPHGVVAVRRDDIATAVGEAIRVTGEARVQQNLVLAGARIMDGDRILDNGTELSPRALGLIAEVGHDKVLARPKPRVVVASVGDDLVDPGLPLTLIGQRYDASTVMIAAAARADGAQTFPAGILPADADAIASNLGEQLVRADLVLLNAEADATLIAALAELGSLEVCRVDGFAAPLAFGRAGADRVPMLVLPANPVAGYLAYQLFARPLVEQLGGRQASDPERVPAKLATAVDTDPRSSAILLAHYTGELARPVPIAGEQGAIELAGANAAILIGPGTEPIAPQTDVDCWLLS